VNASARPLELQSSTSLDAVLPSGTMSRTVQLWCTVSYWTYGHLQYRLGWHSSTSTKSPRKSLPLAAAVRARNGGSTPASGRFATLGTSVDFPSADTTQLCLRELAFLHACQIRPPTNAYQHTDQTGHDRKYPTYCLVGCTWAFTHR
jgi:hypothetical protein